MKFIDIQNLVKGKLKLQGNERSEMALVKSAINQAYVNFAEKDCIMKEFQYLIFNKPLLLPIDFLVYHSFYVTVTNEDLTETTFKVPRHYLEIKANAIMIRDDLLLGVTVKSMKLVYGIKPVELTTDNNVPLIKAIYHMGLTYYALFLITDEKMYYDLYMNVYGNIPIDEYVANYTDIIDVL